MRSEFVANIQLQPAPAAKQPAAPVVTTGKRGSVVYPLGEQIASTVAVHGLTWACAYYASAGVPLEQFLLLARGAGVL